MDKKYKSLRLITGFIYLVGYFFLFIGILEILVLLYGADFLVELVGGTELNDLIFWIQGISGLASIGLLISSLITYLIFTAFSDSIKVLIDIEANTAQLNANSSKIALLLESKFGDKSHAKNHEPTLASYLSDFGQNVESFVLKVIDKIKGQKKIDCPACEGKGILSESDISRLRMEWSHWIPNQGCEVCQSTGKISSEEVKNTLESIVEYHKIHKDFAEDDQMYFETKDLIDEIEKIHGSSDEWFIVRISPVMDKYSFYENSSKDDQLKHHKIMIGVLKAFLKNPEQDLFKVAEKINKILKDHERKMGDFLD